MRGIHLVLIESCLSVNFFLVVFYGSFYVNSWKITVKFLKEKSVGNPCVDVVDSEGAFLPPVMKTNFLEVWVVTCKCSY